MLRQASVEQNNVKGDKRFFVLAVGDAVAWDAASRILTIGFEYRPLSADEQFRAGSRDQQEKLNAETAAAVLKAVAEPLLKERIGKLQGEPGKEKSLLAKHLARYTARNTRDYFIHKDLGGFLRRELDFFLKNEVLHLEDLDWNQPALVQATAARLRTLRLIAGKIVDFLAQIEEFQKRLWEKRKFVVQSDYCMTLDRVPETLYAEIASNDRQRTEWQKLYGVALGPDADLRDHPFLMVDTAFFDDDFKLRLVAGFDDLDEACDGLLVHGENYQALRLLTPRYRGQVKCIYIDPPYNTDAGPILYKNDYRSSSWLSLLADRIHISRDFLMDSGVLCVTIDDYEQPELHFLLVQEYGADNIAATVSIRSNPSGRPVPSGFAQAHEYAIFVTKTPTAVLSKLPRTEEQAARYRHEDDNGSFMWELFRKRGSSSERKDRPSLYYPLFVSGESVRVPKMKWDEEQRVWQVLEDPELYEHVVFPIDDNGVERRWRGQFSDVAANPDNYRAKFENGFVTIYYKFRPRSEGVLPLTFWLDAKYSATEHGTGFLKHYFAEYDVFSYPKSIYAVEDTLRIAGLGEEPGIACDFFAGSGTTGHAVINLNRQDGAKRKFVLAEVGDHFDTVLKPRIQKAVYAKVWRDGRPVPDSPGQSHMFHYLRLESYEDALNNLRFRAMGDESQAALYALPDYFLRYMLDFETRGSPSLLNTEQFDKPFQYQLAITRQQETRPQVVDLVTTFNFLLGLRVRTVRRFEKPVQTSDFSEEIGGRAVPMPVVRVLGEDGAGRRVCVLWRDAPPLEEMEAEKQWLQANVLADVSYDLLYINGESALPDALPIEPEFKRLMFS